MKKLLPLSLLLVTSVSGCGGGTKAVMISLSSTTATVQAAGTMQFTATVANDSANKGVNWSVSCSPAQCGSVSPATTPSGTPTTYTAPSTPPASNLTVTLTVTSVADSTKTATITITIPAIAVAVAPATATVLAGATGQFTATVTNDPATKGVTWSVTCSVAQCGSVAPTTTPNGTATTYTAPSTPPTNTLTVTITATSVSDTTKSNSATITVPTVTISVAPPTSTVLAGATQQFTATVTNTSNTAVTWKLTQGGAACTAACGILSSASTNPVTYTAPAPPASSLSITITATSVADNTKSNSATITVPAITVAVAPPSANVPVKGTQSFTATVSNDATNKGVTWTLTQAGVACSPTCGTVAPTTTPSGTATTYTAPTSVPANPTVTITATSVTDTTKSATATITIGTNACSGYGSGNESVLTGQYAFLVQGFVGNGATSPFVGAGSIAADGKGNITSGEADINQVSGGPAHLIVVATGSSYSIGSDNRGCLTLNFGASNSVTFHFAVGGIAAGVASSGRIIEFDDTTGNGTRNAGIIRQQTTTDFLNSKLQQRYAFGLDGFDMTGGHFALAGSFSTSGGGTTITNGFDDANDGGTVFPPQSNGSGTIGAISATSGRAAATYMTPGSVTNHLVFYLVNANELFAVSADTLTANTPITSGRGIVTGSSFSNSSLNGNYIIHVSGAHANGTGDCTIGLLTLTGGTLSGTLYENNAGVSTTMTPSATYSVDATSGRVTITASGHSPVLYLTTLTDGISAFIVDTGGAADFGLAEFQPAATYTTSSLAGQYFVGTEDPMENNKTMEIGMGAFTAAGGATLTKDSSASGTPFLTSGTVSTGTFTVNANGIGQLDPNTVFITNGTRIFILAQNATVPNVSVAEK